MIYHKNEAIGLMNEWGRDKVPFLFIIDFEMKAIHLFRTDQALPVNIRYEMNCRELNHKVDQPGGMPVFQKLPMSSENYKKAFEKVLHHIKTGNSFLVNLTFPTLVNTNYSLLEIYEKSKAKHKLWMDGKFIVFSPETFVTIKKGMISSFPMKGTMDASIPDAEFLLLSNEKETAEHHTMVDLIRNDLSKISTNVMVKRFRYIDKITTNQGSLLQVSSEITGTLLENFQEQIGSLLFELLPAGSITGAPKNKTIAIIREAEESERGYYTGVFGHFDGENLESAVMIRFIENINGQLFFRSGGGITSLSRWEDEYNELIQKVYVPIV